MRKLQYKPLANPIMFVSDNPSYSGGLSRVCRDLATLACTMPEFRVAVLGRGIGQRLKFPFLLYDYPESMQWGEGYIQDAWQDFSHGESGVIITLDDISRRSWFANPIGLPDSLATFLGDGRNFQKWGYFPVDSLGPNGPILSRRQSDALLKYDRVLGASEFSMKVFGANGRPDADWLPHGIWTGKFHPMILTKFWNEGDIVVGMVAANQERKDFHTAFEVAANLKEQYGNAFKFWIHTDRLLGYWDITALASDYDVQVQVSSNLSDEQLAIKYTESTCTILPTGGEGFGFPIAESLACGTPCVTTQYAAGMELVDQGCRVPCMGFRLETQHNCLRAINDSDNFTRVVVEQIDNAVARPIETKEKCVESVSHLDWNRLGHLWQKWLRKGLQ